MNASMKMNNNESLSYGIFANPNGTFTALTFTRAKDFKTRKGAEKWLKVNAPSLAAKLGL